MTLETSPHFMGTRVASKAIPEPFLSEVTTPTMLLVMQAKWKARHGEGSGVPLQKESFLQEDEQPLTKGWQGIPPGEPE